MSLPALSHWRTQFDMDMICWLTLDRAGESANSLSREVLGELSAIVDHISEVAPRGVVLQSGKKGSFVVGADVREFENVGTAQDAADAIREVHQLFNRIEQLPFPVVVSIEGFCLGGGLELALACHYRIARDVESTRLGFPEVRLGIYPGFGGSARTTELAGGPKALELMLSSRMLSARQARALGLVDQLVPEHGELRWAARAAVLKNKRSRGANLVARMTNGRLFRPMIAGMVRKQTAARVNEKHYPAPFALIDAWEQHGGDRQMMLDAEAENVGQLITGSTSQALRRVFRLMERLKSEGKGSEGKGSEGKGSEGKGSAFKSSRVHVVGAGVMGGDIAAWCVLQGLEVTLQDREMKYIQPALERAGKLFQSKLRSPDLVAGAKSRLLPDVEGNGVVRADVVIEAIFENVDAKRALFQNIESRLKPDAILATNTSAIPLSEIASVLSCPERLIGLHFFNPVARMPLVEVVYDGNSERETIHRAAAFCVQINRFPLPVRSSPGFLVNRVLAPYMQTALRIHRERGVSREALDLAAVEFGMPMGPVELADTVGLDVGLSVMKLLGGESARADVDLVQSFVDAGKLGKKSGEGFYRWKNGKPVREKDASTGTNLKTLAEELMRPYFEECRACLADGIVDDSELLDAGMVFGTGFAPFRGGPIYYLEQMAARQRDRTPDAAAGEINHVP